MSDAEVDYRPTLEESIAACAARDMYAAGARARIAALSPEERHSLEQGRTRHLAEFNREQSLGDDPNWNHQ